MQCMTTQRTLKEMRKTERGGGSCAGAHPSGITMPVSPKVELVSTLESNPGLNQQSSF
jgi:hypothetical protein